MGQASQRKLISVILAVCMVLGIFAFLSARVYGAGDDAQKYSKMLEVGYPYERV